jgi:hypothetical protein
LKKDPYQGMPSQPAENPHLSEIGKGTSSTRAVKSPKFNTASAAEVSLLQRLIEFFRSLKPFGMVAFAASLKRCPDTDLSSNCPTT